MGFFGKTKKDEDILQNNKDVNDNTPTSNTSENTANENTLKSDDDILNDNNY